MSGFCAEALRVNVISVAVTIAEAVRETVFARSAGVTGLVEDEAR